jgi:hypothetical protein
VSEKTYRWSLAAVLAVTMAASTVGIRWGLPNGDRTWAADAVAPMTPLSVAYHVFVENGFDSGYFYFKYPIGHQLLLAAVQAPVVAVAYARGDVEHISTSYPYGFRDPETVLTSLALAERIVSAFATVGIVLLLAATGCALGGREAGVLAALSGLGNYPLLFYAHTSNVEVAFLFWALLALYATVRAVEHGASRWYLVVGGAAAMAVSTKEQIAGFVLPLPLVIVVRHWALRAAREKGWRAPVPRGALAGAVAAVVVFAVVNAIFYNPSGFVHRIQFLTHSLDPQVRERFAPYEFPIDFDTQWTVTDELRHAGRVVRAVGSSVGLPAAAAGVAGIVLMAIRRPWSALYVLAPAAGYYLFSLRVLKQVEIRYVMPLAILLALGTGFALAAAWVRGGAWRIPAIAVVAFGFLWSGEVLWMLVDDSRYHAEKWMAPRLARGETVEVYQSWTYLPRWSRTSGVHRPDFEAISIEDVKRRGPDYIVISSKGKEGMTMYPNPDWRDGRGMMLEREPNRRFVDALESGALGYRPIAGFERRPLFDRELITSLNPAIVVYARDGEGAG